MTAHEKMKLPEFIAPVGLDGTGKGHFTAFLRGQGYLTYGASEILRRVKAEHPDLKDLHPDEAARLLKERLGSTFITDTAFAEYQEKQGDHTGLAIDGLRRLPEIERVKQLKGIVLHVDADHDKRFAQLVERGRADAPSSVEAMLARDAIQLTGDPKDKNSLNMGAIIDLADIRVVNNFDDKFLEDAIAALRNRP
jgi:dephospho-CoA kinase